MRWTPPLLALALCAALAFAMLGGCGVESDTICHAINNPCPGGKVCQGGACTERCDVDYTVCPENIGCDKKSGLCAPYCGVGGSCQPPALCSGGLCIKSQH